MKAAREHRTDLLADSRATLRQVGAVVDELDGMDPEERESPAHMVRTLLRAYGEVVGVIDGLRRSRSSLNQATLARLQSTNAKLDEVSSTTEVAASDMLDDLDHALGLLDQLDELGSDGDDGLRIRGALREHLDSVVNLLQFQDITSQQLGYASGVLNDVERRLAAVASALAQAGGVETEAEEEAAAAEPVLPESRQMTCDPNASTDGSEDRQALADEIFG